MALPKQLYILSEWNVFVLDLIIEEPVLTALQSEIWNCENLEVGTGTDLVCALFTSVHVPLLPSGEPDRFLLFQSVQLRSSYHLHLPLSEQMNKALITPLPSSPENDHLRS